MSDFPLAHEKALPEEGLPMGDRVWTDYGEVGTPVSVGAGAGAVPSVVAFFS